jgi:HPt (histidine-containing phosphotransfer) domain-containing protein
MSQAALDLTIALDYVGGDEELLRELLAILVEDGPAQLQAICDAVASAEPAALMRSAHTLKGALLAIGAVTAGELAAALEAMGRSGEIAASRALLPELERGMAAVLEAAAAARHGRVP